MAKTTVAKGPEITAENATEPVDHHNDEVSQSATLVLRNLGVYILARSEILLTILTKQLGYRNICDFFELVK